MPAVQDPRAALGAWLELRTRLLPPARALRFALVVQALDRAAAQRPLSVLDAAGGDGLLGEAVARRHPAWTVVVGDVNEKLLERGSARTRASGLANVRFERMDLTEDLGTEDYDAVLAIECLSEIPHDDAALANLVRAVRPGGQVLAHVPERDWLPLLRGSEPRWRCEVRHGYTEREIVAKLEQAGAVIVAATPTMHVAVGVAQEVAERLKERSLRRRALVYPALATAVRLERLGLTWGPARALFVEATVPDRPVP